LKEKEGASKREIERQGEKGRAKKRKRGRDRGMCVYFFIFFKQNPALVIQHVSRERDGEQEKGEERKSTMRKKRTKAREKDIFACAWFFC